MPPPLPLIVRFVLPAAADDEAVRVSALVVVVEAGLKLAVTPLGSPVTLNATLLEKPPPGVTVMVLVPLAPCFSVTL